MKRRPYRQEVDCCDNGSAVARIARSFDRRVDGADIDDSALPHQASALLIDLLLDIRVLVPSVLDLGCGTGATAVRLAHAGASLVSGFDVSPASIEIARRRAQRAGLNDRVRFEVADAASSSLPEHDWVILDRVVCCYHDAAALLTNASSAARSSLAFSLPESRGWKGRLNRLTWGVENLGKAILPWPSCRGYVHDLDEVDGLLTQTGFRRLREGWSEPWYVAVYERAQPDPRAT